MTAEEVKDFLQQGKYAAERIQAKVRRIEQLEEIATSITAQPKDGPGGGGGPSKKIEDCAIGIADMQSELTAEIKNLQDVNKQIKTGISVSGLDATEKAILELRYVNHETWDEIAKILSITPRWVYRRHKQALSTIAENWPF